MLTLASVVDALDDRDRLIAHCAAWIGDDDSIDESHYDDIGMALLRALHAGLGDDYTEAVE